MPTARKLTSGTWRVRVYIGKKDGKSITKSFTGPTKKDAERKASTFLAITKHSDMIFSEAAEKYIEAKSNVLSPNTIRTYKLHASRLSMLDNVRVSHLDSEKAQRAVDQISRRLAPKTVASCYGFLTAVLAMFEPGAALRVTLPERVKKETPIPTDEEVDLMIMEAPSSDLKIAIQLAAFGSLRSGEVCALSSDMVQKNHIHIGRTYALDDNQNWIIKQSPKTAAGNRDIPLPGPLMAQIRASNYEDGRIIKYTPSSLHDAFRRLTKRLKIYPYKFHSLRHYFATMLHSQGIPDKVIAKLGGWEDVSTLQKIYQHATADRMEEASKILNDLFADRVSLKKG